MVYPAWIENINVICKNVSYKSRVHPRPVILYLSSITCNIFTSSFPVLFWLGSDDLKALELMTEIMKRLKEREQKQAIEKVVVYEAFINI